MFFEVAVSIGHSFPALSPIQLRREQSGEVFKLMQRMAKRSARESEKYTIRNGQKYRLIKAKNWY